VLDGNGMSGGTEAFARARIDELLKDAGWNPVGGSNVLFEHTLPDGTRADYVLCDRRGRPLAVVEAKRASVHPGMAQGQGRHYARQLDVPFVFLSNGEKVHFQDLEVDAHAREIAGFYAQEDLERRVAARRARRDLSEVSTDRRIVDRDYQIQCIEVLSDEVLRGRRKLLVEMATGTGKTRVALAFVKRLFEAGIVTRVLFLVDRLELARQAADACTDHLGGYPSQVLKGQGVDRNKRIVIATLQTMIKEFRKLSPGYFDLVVTDECHRSIYGKYSGVLRHFDSIQLGLTATPCTAEIDAFPDPEDGKSVRDTLRFFGLERPTFRYGLRQAVNEGHLVPYRIYRAKTVKTAAVDGFEVQRKELDWSAMDVAMRAEFGQLFQSSDSIVVDPRALERRFSIPERNRAMVREFRDALEKGFLGRGGIWRRPEQGKTIVFAVTKRHAQTLAEMFDDEFADLKPDPTVRYADFVVSDVGDGPAPDASAIIRRFKNEDFPKILVSVNMLDTGFDCPEVVNLVMARFTRSTVLYRQMRGRGTRKAPHIGKSAFTIFDFVGVTEYHGDNDDAIDGGTVSAAERKPKSRSGMLLALDVDDHIDPASRDWLTMDEDGRIVRTPEHEARASAISLRFEGWRGAQGGLNAEQTRWIGLMGSHAMANAEDSQPFGDWSFEQSSFAALGGCKKAREVFGGAEALDRLISGFNSAVLDPPRNTDDSAQEQ